MKLLYFFITLYLVQLLSPINALAITNSASNVTKLWQNKYKESLKTGITSLAKDYCEKAKQLSEQILKDTKIQQLNTTKSKIFKENIKNFLHNYSFYQRHGLYDYLFKIFDDIIKNLSHREKGTKRKDAKVLWKLINDIGYAILFNEYEKKFEDFIKQQFQPKFEEFKKQLTKEELKQRPGLLITYGQMKLCRHYECYNDHYNIVKRLIVDPKENIRNLVEELMERITIFDVLAAKELTEAILKDPKLKQLSSNLNQQLVKDLKDYVSKYERHTKFENLYELIYNNVIITNKYYKSKVYSAKDQQLLKDIFEGNGFKELNTFNQVYVNEFVDHAVPKIFKKLDNEGTKDKVIEYWFNELPELQTFKQRVKDMKKFHNIKNILIL